MKPNTHRVSKNHDFFIKKGKKSDFLFESDFFKFKLGHDLH